MDNNKRMTPEEIRAKAESWAYLCRQIGSRINWSDAFVSGYRTCENEKDELLKEAIKLLDRALTYMIPENSNEGDDIEYDIKLFVNKTTGSEAGNDVR